MKFPHWMPASFRNEVTSYQKFISEPWSATHPDIEALKRRGEMWTRLMTRPEMEAVWTFIFSRSDVSICAEPERLVRSNGGMVERLDRYMRAFDAAPILSSQGYKDEMKQISQLAERLSAKLKKFCDAEFLHNPFLNRSMFERDQLEGIAMKIVNPKFFENVKSNESVESVTAHLLDRYLPPVNEQLRSLARAAKTELSDPRHRLQRLPRKVGDANVFRTYFVLGARNIFLSDFADGSHARLATFCSVALDDPEITADLVRKIAPIDNETKDWLNEFKGRAPPEH